MSSGLYAALSGALARMETVETVTNNLSNANTPGFKKDRLSFAAVLNQATQTNRSAGVNYAYIPDKKIDFSEGVTIQTSRDLDVAIEGKGFFKVKVGEQEFFTRLGNFTRSSDGKLVTRSGALVLGSGGQPIELPDGSINIDENGVIIGKDGEAGRLGLFAPDEAQLVKRGSGLFSYNGDSTAVEQSSDAQILQHHLEGSNVQSMQEVVVMMTSMRGFESYQKAMKNYFSIEEKTNEIGAL
ncbi:MAG: flagellar basal-body rod protein FlgF [Desulfobacteraceae bacterium 4572_35.1]|nr:MAG: flagellar basal-body rod protein FlgF [Desulfobacteraceae bacterium 4572_35.1]